MVVFKVYYGHSFFYCIHFMSFVKDTFSEEQEDLSHGSTTTDFFPPTKAVLRQIFFFTKVSDMAVQQLTFFTKVSGMVIQQLTFHKDFRHDSATNDFFMKVLDTIVQRMTFS